MNAIGKQQLSLLSALVTFFHITSGKTNNQSGTELDEQVAAKTVIGNLLTYANVADTDLPRVVRTAVSLAMKEQRIKDRDRDRAAVYELPIKKGNMKDRKFSM